MEAFGANSEDVSIRWSIHLDLHGGWSCRRRIQRHALKSLLEHVRAAWQEARSIITKSLKIPGKQFWHTVAPDLVVKVFVVSYERNVHLQMVQCDDVEVVL